MEKLDRDKVRQTLVDSDLKWFSTHTGQYDYQAYLDFTAEYIAIHYHRRNKVGQRHGSSKTSLRKRE